MNDLDILIKEWLTLPDVAELLDVEVSTVRQMLRDRHLVGLRRGERNVLSVPAAFVQSGAVLPELRGTLNVLRDAGFDDESSMRWLFTPDDTLPGTPVDAMRAGWKTEIRRRAQALAF